jgi:hypothetical protein
MRLHSRQMLPRMNYRLCPKLQLRVLAICSCAARATALRRYNAAQSVALALGRHRPFLMVTDGPYGVELDMNWRETCPAPTTPFNAR